MKNDNDLFGHLERKELKRPKLPGIETRTEGYIGPKNAWKIETLIWINAAGWGGVIIWQMFRGLLW